MVYIVGYLVSVISFDSLTFTLFLQVTLSPAPHNFVCTESLLDHHKSSQSLSGIFQVLHMDILGAVPTPSSRSNRYGIILTENLSKYAIAEALPDFTAKSEAKLFIDRFVLFHGTPERLVTDNGTHFNRHLLRTITISMNIPHAFSASYYPQTNG